MSYIIDVITNRRANNFKDAWCAAVRPLAASPGFVHAELFAMRRDLGGAHYDFLAVYRWRDGNARAAALAKDRPPASMDDALIERIVCDLQIQLSEFTLPANDAAWLINPFEIGESDIPDVLDMWDKAKDHMVSKPGFVNARLFRTAGPIERYGLVNVAQWQTAELFMQALGDKAYAPHRERSKQYVLHPSVCERAACIVAEPIHMEEARSSC
jgi:heme-degrading monooxygenase HmoA